MFVLYGQRKKTHREKKEINKKKKNTLCTNICKRAHKRFCCVCDCKYTRFMYTNVYKRLFCADIISNIELETLQTLNIYVYVRIYAVSFLFRWQFFSFHRSFCLHCALGNIYGECCIFFLLFASLENLLVFLFTEMRKPWGSCKNTVIDFFWCTV